MLSTYAELKAAVQEDLDRDDDNIDSLIERFIFFAEKQLSKRLKVMAMEGSTTLSLVGGAADLPDDFRGVRYVRSGTAPLQSLTSQQLEELYPIATVGQPKHYAIEAGRIRTYPVSTGDITLGYYQAIPHLSDSNTSNWLLDSSPELYMAAVLVQGFKHFLDTEAMAIQSDWVNAEINALNGQDSDERFALLADVPEGPRP